MSKCENKKCRPDQICNPKTGRCVLKTGRIGKALLAKSKSKRRSVSRKKKSKSVSRKSRSKTRSKSVSRKSRSKSRSKKVSCRFDNYGICEKADKGPNDKRCTYSASEKRCVYSKSFLKTRKKDLVLVLQSAGDHNNAFDKDGDAGLFALLRKNKNFNFMYRKIYTEKDLKTIIESIPRDVKISKLIIMAHGTKTGILIGSKYHITNKNVKYWADLLKPHLAKNPNILLHSCLTGSGGTSDPDNFANRLLKNLPKGTTIYASEKSIKRGELLVLSMLTDFNRRKFALKYMIDPDAGYQIYEFKK